MATLCVAILKEQGIDEAKFMAACKEVASKNDEESQTNFYVQILISLAEYENFIAMMQSHKLSHN